MSKKTAYIFLSTLVLAIIVVASLFLFYKRETPERAVQETVSSIVNKDHNLFMERVNLPVITNYVYSELVMKKKEPIPEDLTPFENAVNKVTKQIMIFFAPSNKEEISDLISDYLLRDSIPNSSLFNKERFFEFLDNVEKNSVSVKLLSIDKTSFRVRLFFYQKIIDQRLSVDFGYQNNNGKWILTEVDGIQRLMTVYTAKRSMVMAQKFKDQQNVLKSHLLVEEINVNSNKDIIGSFFRIRVKVKNIGKEDIFGYGIKVGFYNDAGELSPYEVISQESSLSPGESKVFFLEPKARLLEFKMANNRGQNIDSRIVYINLENETLKTLSEESL